MIKSLEYFKVHDVAILLVKYQNIFDLTIQEKTIFKAGKSAILSLHKTNNKKAYTVLFQKLDILNKLQLRKFTEAQAFFWKKTK